MEIKAPRLVGLVALAALAAGCDGSTPAAPVIDAGPLYSCETEDRAVAYEPNLTRTSASGTYTAVLVAADPAPPAKGNNMWTVEIRDANQMPVDGLTITPSALMIDHGHPPAVKPKAAALGNGQYTIMPLDLFMAGYWEVTLAWQPEGGARETIVFNICVPG
jgi:hypothetical protein